MLPANVSYPTDSGLLARAVRRIAATGRRVQAAGGATRTRVRDRSRAAGKRAHAIAVKLSSRAAQAKLHEPDARPIAKGRLGKPVEFGYKAQVTDNDDGVILDYAVEQGNPTDGPQLAPAIERVIKRTGKKPRTVTADRSYGERPVEDDLRALGVA